MNFFLSYIFEISCTQGNQGSGQYHAASPLSCHILLYQHTQVDPHGCSPCTPANVQPQHFVAPNVPKERTSSFLLAGDPVCGFHQRSCWKLDPKPCPGAGVAAGTGAQASQRPRVLTLEASLLRSHMYNTSVPLIQIRCNWKRCYSSEATAIIPAMAMEKERHWYPEAMLCCSKNDERSPSGHKARLSWPHYRYSLQTCQANNALVVRKCRCEELYLNFKTFP